MQRYRDFRPTGFDAKGAFLDDDRQDWIVAPVSQTRDSGPINQSNFASAQSILDDAKAEYEIHRFGHWGPGWFEIILVNPAFETVVEDIESSLENYPVLDEDDLSQRERELANECWRNYGESDFVDAIRHSFELTEDEDNMLDFYVDIDAVWSECRKHVGWDYQIEGDSSVFNFREAIEWLKAHSDVLYDAIDASYKSEKYLKHLKDKEDEKLARWIAATKVS